MLVLLTYLKYYPRKTGNLKISNIDKICLLYNKNKEQKNVAVWQIRYLERLLATIIKDLQRDLSMILVTQIIYTKYLNKTNKKEKKRDKICICALKLE